MPRKFTLTEANYHSRAARRRWLSSSDVKAAKRCEAAWLADYCGKIKHKENKPAFAFGHLFEAALTLPGPQYHQYLTAHPELCSSRGPTKGQLRADLAAAPLPVGHRAAQQKAGDFDRRAERDAHAGDDGPC